jgi:hypothetical protein
LLMIVASLWVLICHPRRCQQDRRENFGAPAPHTSLRPADRRRHPAEHPVDRCCHISGQRVVSGLGQLGWLSGRVGRCEGTGERVRFRFALSADRLAQPPGQGSGTAARAAVELGGPVRVRLALRADQDLLVSSNATPPGAGPPIGIGLARSAAVAGHRVLRSVSSRSPCRDRWRIAHRRADRGPRGATSLIPDQSGAADTVVVVDSPAVGAASVTSLGST